jgi:hypothetical protein
MAIEFDDKGKFFTDVIMKDVVPVILQTTTHRVEGNIHVCSGARIKDELERDEKSLAITNAIVYTAGGDVMYQCKFMSIQRSQIVWVIPDEEHRSNVKPT